MTRPTAAVIATYTEEYYVRRREAALAYQRSYYAKNKEKLFASQRSHYAQNIKELKKLREENPEVLRVKHAQYNQSLKGKWSKYRRNSRKRKLVFTLSEQEFATLCTSPCYYHGGPEPSGGIDRVNNFGGYTSENSVPCCRACNFMKHTSSQAEFLERVRLIAEHFKPNMGVVVT